MGLFGLISSRKSTSNTSNQETTNYNVAGGSGDTIFAAEGASIEVTDGGAFEFAELAAQEFADYGRAAAGQAFGFADDVLSFAGGAVSSAINLARDRSQSEAAQLTDKMLMVGGFVAAAFALVAIFGGKR